MGIKKLGIIATLCAAPALVVACGTSKPSNSSSGNSTSGSKTVTISEMDYYTAQTQASAIKNLISQFEQSHPNIKIDRTAVPYTQLLPKSLQEATSHTLPTILVTDNLNIPTMVQTGGLVPLTSVGQVDTSQYLKGSLTTVTQNGKLYGLPVGNNDLALYYNKTMLKQAGISSPPKTWSELLTDAKKLHKGSTYGIAFSAPNNEQAMWQLAPFVWSNGGKFTQMSSSGAEQAVNLWAKLVKEGGASKSVVNFSQTDVYNEFAAGRAAMMVMGPWEIPALKGKNIKYGVAPLPVNQSSQQMMSPIGGEAWTIAKNASTAQKKAAFTFIKWVQNKTRLEKFDAAFGYMPAYKPAFNQFVKDHQNYAVFANQLKHSQALFTNVGTNLPKVSDAVATALQSALTGSSTTQAAVKTAQQTISALPKN
ncbi:ABC transporter substrate-binding protein [Alicyclobacillus sp. SO9]|uniref:ABC transporter substrate-binding protein n=1 Tax=Alicyclobacillus sp. SO9 TaxID=2665646 RepID=UPI0018E86FAE|nr:ABC transporter substrate-binding protein [Alicyclobacillus sp. SO9]QQE77993.1 ABC transporter substrate-binding protein [Alicyclobacillus sp. SO9]